MKRFLILAENKSLKQTILYFHPGRSSFVQKDIAILEKNYRVKEFVFNPKKKWLTPITYLRQKLFLIVNIFSCKMIVCMFAGHHSLLPSLIGNFFHKPCLIISAGTDCVSFPSINYGNFRGGVLTKVTKWSYELATHIAPVHKNLISYNYSYDNEDFKQQGIKIFMPDLKTPFTVINFSFDSDQWIESKERIPNSFITVAAGLDKPYRAKLKGIDLIIEAAPFFPEAKFSIIGCPDNYKLKLRSKNIIVHSFVTNAQLKDFYNTHEFYVQVSMSEGFPNAICEAMICGCIPIGSNVGGISDIIGDTGFMLVKRDVEQFKVLIREAINANKKTLSHKSRARIMEKYPKDLREKELTSLARELIKKK